MQTEQEALDMIDRIKGGSRVGVILIVIGLVTIAAGFVFMAVYFANQQAELSAREQNLRSQAAALEVIQRRLTADSSPEVVVEAAEVAEQASSIPVEATADPSPPLRPYSAVDIDIFHCVAGGDAARRRAEEVAALRTGADTGRWRVRPLSQAVNERPGYRISGNQIRYNRGGDLSEEFMATALQGDVRAELGLELTLRRVGMRTPGYLSVFLCAE